MPKFAANLTMLFTEVDFLERFARARQAGFSGVEYLFPYDYDKQELREKLDENQLIQVLHNLPAGDWSAGERGLAILPDRKEEFLDGVERAIDYAVTLGCRKLNCLAGIVPEDEDPQLLYNTFVDNLKVASQKLAEHNIQLLIEPINTIDIPGFYLNHSQQAIDIISAIGVNNVGLQYDIYHMQIMEGDLARTIEKHLPSIAHMQLADNPGRHEPGSGEINYPFLFSRLDKLDYQGWLGCEYIPAENTISGLSWLKSFLR